MMFLSKRKYWLNSRKLIDKIVENWPAKVLSIALAIILFVFHRMNTLTTRPLSVPLTIESGAALIPAGPYPQNVRLVLRGEDDSIKSIAEGDIEAYADFSRHETEGLYHAPVQIRRKGSALGIEQLEMSVKPLEISLQLDRRMSKTLPVRAAFRGKLASGYDLVTHSISPSEMVVAGPMSAMESITELRTEAIDLEGRSGDFRMMVNIVNPNQFFIINGGETAEFRGVVRPSVPVRNFEGIPITLIGLDPLFAADFGGKTGSVRLEGNQDNLDAYKPDENFFTVDCSGLTGPGWYTLPVTVNLPRGFTLIKREPEELAVTITLNEELLPGNSGDVVGYRHRN